MKYVWALIGSLSLLIGSMTISSANTEELTKIQKSDSDSGITITLNDYEKSSDYLTIHYTVTSKSKLEGDKLGQPFLDRPTLHINQKFLNTSLQEKIQKVGDNKYTGYLSIKLKDDMKADHFNLSFKTNRISNQNGTWKIDFDLNP